MSTSHSSQSSSQSTSILDDINSDSSNANSITDDRNPNPNHNSNNVVIQISQPQQRNNLRNSSNNQTTSTAAAATTSTAVQQQPRCVYLNISDIPPENFRIAATTAVATNVSSGDSTSSSSSSSFTNVQPKFITLSSTSGPIKLPTQVFRQIQQQFQQQQQASLSTTTATVNLVPVSSISSNNSNQQFELASLLSPSTSKQQQSSNNSTTTTNFSSPTTTFTTDVSTTTAAICNNTSRYIPRVPITDDGIGVCKRCGAVGVKDTFYGKGKQFCSPSCVRGIATTTAPGGGTGSAGTNHHHRQPLFKLVKVPVKTSTGSNSGGSGDQSQTMVTLAMPLTIGGGAAPATSTHQALTPITVTNPIQQSGQSDNKQTIISLGGEQQTIDSSQIITSTSTSSSTMMKSRTLIIRQPTSTIQQQQASATNRSGSHQHHHHHTSLVNQKQLAQQLAVTVAHQQQQQQSSIHIDPSNVAASSSSSSSSSSGHQQVATGQSQRNIKRSYSKIVALSSSNQQQQSSTGQIQLTNNGTLLAVQLNQQNNGQQQQQQQQSVQQTPKRTKRNSGQQQQQQQNGGQEAQQSNPNLSNQASKRSRSKSNSSVASSNQSTASFLVDNNNSIILQNNDAIDAMLGTSSTTTPHTKTTSLDSKSSPNSILISQLKKPVAVVAMNPTTSTTAATINTSTSTSSTGTLTTSNQSIQTNSSPLFVQLASISSAGANSTNLHQQIQPTSASHSQRTIPTSTISNQQLQQFLQQNNLRIAAAHHQQVASLHGSQITAIPIRSVATSATVPNNNSTQGQHSSAVAADISRLTHLLQLHQQQQQQQNQVHIQVHHHQNQQQQPIPNSNLIITNVNNVQQHKPQNDHVKVMEMRSESQQQQIKTAILTPKPISKMEEIKALDAAVHSAMNTLPGPFFQQTTAVNSNSSGSGNGNQNSFSRTNYVNINNNNGRSSSSGSSNLNYYPPVWGLIFEKYGYDRCAPVWAFPNMPLSQQWPLLFGFMLNQNQSQDEENEQKPNNKKDFYVEIRLSDQDLLGQQQSSNGPMVCGGGPNTPTTPNKSFKSKKNSSFDFVVPVNATSASDVDENNDQKFWIAKIVGHSGYYLRLRYVGLEHLTSNRYDFWINIRLRNLYPIGYAQQNHRQYRPPREVCDLNANYMTDLRRFLSTMSTNVQSIKSDLYTVFQKQIETELKPGLKVEAIDKIRLNCFRVATIQQVIGQRCFLRYDGEAPDDTGWWTHVHSEQLRPVGWSQLVGHKLFASSEYAMKSLQRGVANIRHHIKSNRDRGDWNKFGVLKKFEFINEDSIFREGMKVEMVNPGELSTICVATVRKVLRFNFLVLSIDDIVKDQHRQTSLQSPNSPSSYYFHHVSTSPFEQEDRMFCMHASSPYILPAGFCKAFGIPLQPPIGYNREFDWVEYCEQTNSLMAPTDLFSYKQFITNDFENGLEAICDGFEEGMLLEAVDMMEPNLVCLAVIKRRAGRLLQLHFIGWDDSYDQWCDCCSPNIFPVGYCDLVEYPLQGPPVPQQNNSSTKKKQRHNNHYAYNGGYNNRKRNKKSPLTISSTLKSSPISTKSSYRSHQQQSSMSYGSEMMKIEDDSMHSSSFDSMTKGTFHENMDDKQQLFFEIDDFELKDRNGNLDSNNDNDDDDGKDDEEELEEDSVWLQIIERERSELYNFLSWNETITNGGRFEYHNKFLLPLRSKIDLGNGRRICFNDHLLEQKRLNLKLSNDQHKFDVEWNFPDHNVKQDDDSKLRNNDDNYKDKIKVYDFYYYFDPEDMDGPDGTNDIRMLPHWSSKQVSKFLYRNGFSDLCDSIHVFKIDGKRLLSLTRNQAIRIALTPSTANRLLKFIEYIQKRLSVHHQQQQHSHNSINNNSMSLVN